MSAHLEAVRIARDHRAAQAGELSQADAAYRAAIVRAHDNGESLRTIARAAGVTFSGVRYIIQQERQET